MERSMSKSRVFSSLSRVRASLRVAKNEKGMSSRLASRKTFDVVLVES